MQVVIFAALATDAVLLATVYSADREAAVAVAAALAVGTAVAIIVTATLQREARRRVRTWLEAASRDLAHDRWPVAATREQSDLLETLRPAWEGNRHASAVYREVIAGMDLAVVALEANDRLAFCNPAARPMLALAGVEPGQAVPSLHRIPGLMELVRQARAGGSASSGRLTLPDGRTLQVEVAPLPGGAGSVSVLARDITEMVRLERTRRDFIAGISHELRTPLTSIRGYAELLLQGSPELDGTRRQEFLQTIISNTERLTQLAHDLITLSAIETGEYPFHFQPVDVGTLIESAVAVVRPIAAGRGGQIEIGRLEQATINADPDAMHRVLVNLIENGFRHGGAGVTVRVGAERERGACAISIADNGKGIPRQEQDRVFERFYRVDRSHSREGGGSGLGLALVKHIVLEHHGSVDLKSEVGAGSTFVVHLPAAEPNPAAIVSQAPAVAPQERR
jgi:two-component system phosphate regulon sensor histidine kinase PhoR